jgi:hypothetical protein
MSPFILTSMSYQLHNAQYSSRCLCWGTTRTNDHPAGHTPPEHVADHVEVVGLGITEHLPWDALIIRDMLRKLPLVGNSRA